jgi:Ca2+-binding EF-hand superfamily protein
LLDKQEFYWGLKNLGVNISKREAGILLEYLDTSKDGFVDFNEFVFGIRGLPS